LKKKIGILTFHNSPNFGALLQTLGTYETIKRLGHLPEVINYHSPNKLHMYKLIDINLKRSLSYNFKSIINYPLTKKKLKNSFEFQKESLMIKKEIVTTFKELREIGRGIDKLIVGSDQVWNYENTGFDKRYFLDFVPRNKKIAYAPSFGRKFIEDQYIGDYIHFLKDFAFLSVRERDGVEIIRELIQENVNQVLDPTLLLSKDDWEKTMQPYKNFSKFLVVYMVGNKSNTLSVAKKIAQKKGLKMIVIPTGISDFFKPFKTVIPTVNEFIGLLNNASYIVTSSFHGLAFAINLNTEFTVCLTENSQKNTRQLSLLSMTGLEERVCYDSGNSLIEIDSIEWSIVNKKLEKERKKSLDFLKKSLE